MLRDTPLSIGGILLQCAVGTEHRTESETLCLNPRSALGCVPKGKSFNFSELQFLHLGNR